MFNHSSYLKNLYKYIQYKACLKSSPRTILLMGRSERSEIACGYMKLGFTKPFWVGLSLPHHLAVTTRLS